MAIDNDVPAIPDVAMPDVGSALADNTAQAVPKPTGADLDRQAADYVLHNQGSQIRNNVLSSLNQSPDQAAQYQALAKQTGTPVESVYANPDAVKAQAAMLNMDADKLATQYPHLAQYLTNRYNAAKSSDDIQNLAGVEQTAKALPAAAPANGVPDLDGSNKQTDSPFLNWLSSINNPDAGEDNTGPDAMQQAAGSFAGGLESSVTRAARGVNLAMSVFPSAYDSAAGIMSGQNEHTALNAYNKIFIEPLDQRAKENAFDARPDLLSKTLHASGDVLGTIAMIAATGGMGAAAEIPAGASALEGSAAIVSGAARTMAMPAITGALNTGHDVYAQTGSLVQAVAAATSSYGQTVGMGLLPMSLPGGAVKRVLTGLPVGGVTGEMMRNISNLTMPASMQTPANLDDILVNSITGAVLAGAMGGGHAPVQDAIQTAYDNGLKAMQSGELMAHLQGLDQMAAKAKTRERDADAFHEFVSTMTEDGHAPDVYIDAHTLNEVLAQSGIKPEDLQQKLPGVSDQMNAGLNTNGLVRIPLADYATSIAGTPLSEQLLPHLKTDPEGMTYSEGQAYAQSQKDTLTQQAKTLTEAQANYDERQQQLQDIGQNITDQLKATGRFTDSQSKAYAAMHMATFDTLSSRLDMTPERMYQDFPLKVQNATPEAIAALGGDELRGGFTPQDTTIHLANADLSTFLHESGHFYLEMMHQLAGRSDLPPQMRNDFDTLLQSFKVAGDTPEERMSNWTGLDMEGKRAGHEQFAEGFERYLMTGRAPTVELQSMFGRFRSWLMQVYKNLGNIGEPISPEVKGVMDRLFATDQAINAAEKTNAFIEAADLSAHATPEELAQYFNLHDEAHRDALDAMQARSLRNIKWLDNAKSRVLKDLQNEAKGERAKIRDEVTKQVQDEPVYKAERFLRRGEMDKPVNETNAQRKARESTLGYSSKLNLGDLKEMYGDGPAAQWRYLDTGKSGLAGKDGLHPDLVADMFGFNSGRELVDALLHAAKIKDKIAGMTDQRMLEEHGDLVDPVSIQEAARAAIHNEGRAKMMATGLKILSKSPVSSAEINKQAKAAADTAIAAAKVGEIRPAKYSAAEAKANKELIKLAPTDTMGAVGQQRAALLNNRLYKSAQEGLEDVRKGLVYLKRFTRDTTRGKIALAERDLIDDLLSRFDLRANPTDKPTRAQQNLEQYVESQRAAGMVPSITADMFKPEYRMPYREMTLESFRGMVDSIKSLEKLGRSHEEIMVSGEKRDLKEFVNSEVVPKIQERGARFTTEQLHTRIDDRGSSWLREALDTVSSLLRSTHAQLEGQQFKANAYDRHDILGPMTRAVFEPIFQANYLKNDRLKAISNDFRAKVQELGRPWQKSLNDMVANRTLVDKLATEHNGGQVEYMKINRGKMVIMGLNVGNESNFDKMVKGYGWEPAKVWQFLHENMTREDWKAAQALGEAQSKHWAESEAMQRRLGQTVPDRIEPRPFMTKFGEMPGWYSKISYDPLRSKKGERDAAAKAIDPGAGLFGPDAFNRRTTTNGSMNARKDGYTDAIDLNFHTVERNIHDSIHDLSYREALINANKILEHPDFRREFMKAYGREDFQALQEWLGRIANSENYDRQAGAFGRIMQYTRSGLVMNAIALRVSTILKHGGSAGIKTVGYFVGGGEKFLAARFAQMGTNYKAQMREAMDKIPELRSRAMQQDRDYRSTASSLFTAETLQSRAERFGHAAVAWADLFTAVPTGLAAYDRAITEGIPVRQGGTGKPMTEAQAVAYASKIVREAHGSNIETARSNIMTNPHEGIKMMTMIYGFMNNNYGQMADSISKFRTPGMGKPEILARAFMSLIIPALWAELLNDGIPKADKWSHFVGKAITGEVAGSVPLLRDAYSMAQDFRGAGVVGAESWMTSIANGGKAIYRVSQGEVSKGKPIGAIADMLGMGLHIPGLGQLGKSAQNIVDMESGNAYKPDNLPDYLYSTVMKPKKPHF